MRHNLQILASLCEAAPLARCMGYVWITSLRILLETLTLRASLTKYAQVRGYWSLKARLLVSIVVVRKNTAFISSDPEIRLRFRSCGQNEKVE